MGAGCHVADRLVHVAGLAGERPVDGVDDGHRRERAEGQAEQAGMVVNDVELTCALQAGDGVAQLPERVTDPLARRRRVDGLELGRRPRVARREERHVGPRVDEALRQ